MVPVMSFSFFLLLFTAYFCATEISSLKLYFLSGQPAGDLYDDTAVTGSAVKGRHYIHWSINFFSEIFCITCFADKSYDDLDAPIGKTYPTLLGKGT